MVKTTTVSDEITRRRIITALGGAGAIGLAGCSGDSDGNGGNGSGDGSGETTTTTSGASEDAIELTLKTHSTTEGNLERLGNQLSMATDWAAERMDGQTIATEIDSTPVDSYNDNLKVQLGANEGPDIFEMLPEWYGSYYSSDNLYDLTEYMTDEYLDGFHETWLEPFRRDGGLYGLPKDTQTYVLIYNEAMLSEAGWDSPPETWEDFRGALSDIGENTDVQYPMVEWLWEPFSWWSMKFQLDGRIMNDDNTECVIANDGNVQVLEYLQSLREDELLGFTDEVDSSSIFDALGNHETAVTVAGAWPFSIINNNYPDVGPNIKAAHLPHPADAERGTGKFTLPWSVSSQTSNPEAAVKTLMGMGSTDAMWEWLQTGVAASPRKDHSQGDYYEDMPWMETVVEAFDYAQGPVFMWGPHSEEIRNTIDQTIEAIYRLQMEPQDGLESIQRTVNSQVL